MIAVGIAVALAVILLLSKHFLTTPMIAIDSGTVPIETNTSVPSQAPTTPTHFYETKAMDSALAAYGTQWEHIRQLPKTLLGQNFTWTARVLSVTGERVAIGWPGHIIEYDMDEEVPPPPGLSVEELLEYNSMVPRGLPDVYTNDIICLTGTLTKVTPAGTLEFDPKSLVNYGHK